MNQALTPNQVITELRQAFINDRFQFDMLCTTYLSGDHNKQLRKDVVKIVTAEDRPSTKCGLFAVSDILRGHFNQQTLF
jgi:hypothetical protein